MWMFMGDISPNNVFQRTLFRVLLVGLVTSVAVVSLPQSNEEWIRNFGGLAGGIGNDLFLLLSNTIIIGWAWRKRMKSIVKMTLLFDLAVFISVQGIKLLKLEPWYLRPNGGTGGFPSGHATHAFGMAFLLTLFFPRFSWLWFSCASLISWSRVETGWHTGFQVICGIILGIALAWLFAQKWLAHPDAAIARLQMPPKDKKVAVQPPYATDL